MKVVWVSSWSRKCGIADYSKLLWPFIEGELKKNGHTLHLLSLDEARTHEEMIEEIVRIQPDLVHFQHEYGLYGNKNVAIHRFPNLVKKIRKKLPSLPLIATAHTVLPADYKFPVHGRGWQVPFRIATNLLILPYLKKVWGPQTWGALDGVIVHSKSQMKWVQEKHNQVREIPHFVPEASLCPPSQSSSKVLVFGFFTPEKGQDVVIEALPYLDKNVKLVLAGGVRRSQDRRYYERCLNRIAELGFKNRVELTGFLKIDQLDQYYSDAALVVAPFRETSGSGTLVQALARGSALLASNLALNKELGDRETGCLELFKSEDPQDCAKKITELLKDFEKRLQLSQAAKRYAQKFSLLKTAQAHVDFYKNF